jgi:NAD(P)-dependent dehydrogenase (short-subunit alcohol dehydrogenase family)
MKWEVDEPREQILHPIACYDCTQMIFGALMPDKLAIITGASSGISLSSHRKLFPADDLVVCSAGERLPEAAEIVRSSGAQVVPVTADLSTRVGVELFWNQVVDLGRPVFRCGLR